MDGQEKYGPFTLEELKSTNIARSTKIWFYGLEKWTELNEISELTNLANAIPPTLSPEHSEPMTMLLDQESASSGFLREPKVVKKPYAKKVLAGVVGLLAISIVLFLLNKRTSNIALYNSIVENSFESNETFDSYIEKFYRDLEYHGIYPKRPKTSIIRFSKLDRIDNATHIHGVSYGLNDDDKIEIYINPTTWEQFNRAMKYTLIYHELAHDVLNLKDLKVSSHNEGKLMYPELATLENKSMDDFIESVHSLFENYSKR